ncbi:hypothetical protein, partial [Cognatilysobacter terrigena]|uniref:hypothetical protein n=1 Tax=Cognatilysobacter terrigena TaxID=2488749 RepID=UPI001AAD8D5F
FRGTAPIEYEGTADTTGCVSLGGITGSNPYYFTTLVEATGYKPLRLEIPTKESVWRIVLAKQSEALASRATELEKHAAESPCGAI